MAESPLPLMVVPPEASSTRAQASGSWAPEGTDNGLRWRRRKKAPPPAGESLGYICMAQLSPVTASDNLRKKALDREVPYHMIPRQDLALYEAAEIKEWKSWQDLECVEVIHPAKAKEVMKRIPRSRLIKLRFVYRDKNTALRTVQTPLPIKAKARLCAQGSREPLAMRGALSSWIAPRCSGQVSWCSFSSWRLSVGIPIGGRATSRPPSSRDASETNQRLVSCISCHLLGH